ncbi:hypothetical protein [Flammeovirga sp. EKP202]|uniref:N-acyl amino acid synthase FeeM domain-containing protein n=1 Tax=Flammeovirga sp. EKP202 TaxID=2770592 RepID=UPI00165EC7F2|nr:hypothetical protein [Flammeovirga sp. EKP202]MBD0403614.1 hypothetical protein [Flammeovirga sp. EKP202]
MTKNVSIDFLNKNQLNDLYDFVYKQYVESGLANKDSKKKIQNAIRIDQLDNTCIFVAKYNEQIVGTVSVTYDQNDTNSPLPNEPLFPNEFSKIHKAGSPVCNGWRVAIDRNFSSGFLLYKSLILKVVQHALNKGHKNTYIVTTSSQSRVYKKMFDVKIISNKMVSGVVFYGNDTPLSLMEIDLKKMEEYLTKK